MPGIAVIVGDPQPGICAHQQLSSAGLGQGLNPTFGQDAALGEDGNNRFYLVIADSRIQPGLIDQPFR